jgi:hypothetical protein
MFATPNNMCLQHRYSASATSKLNICNIEKFRHNFETFEWDTCNMCAMICNINEKRLHLMQHRYKNLCNIDMQLIQHL